MAEKKNTNCELEKKYKNSRLTSGDGKYELKALIVLT